MFVLPYRQKTAQSGTWHAMVRSLPKSLVIGAHLWVPLGFSQQGNLLEIAVDPQAFRERRVRPLWARRRHSSRPFILMSPVGAKSPRLQDQVEWLRRIPVDCSEAAKASKKPGRKVDSGCQIWSSSMHLFLAHTCDFPFPPQSWSPKAKTG